MDLMGFIHPKCFQYAFLGQQYEGIPGKGHIFLRRRNTFGSQLKEDDWIRNDG